MGVTQVLTTRCVGGKRPSPANTADAFPWTSPLGSYTIHADSLRLDKTKVATCPRGSQEPALTGSALPGGHGAPQMPDCPSEASFLQLCPGCPDAAPAHEF